MGCKCLSARSVAEPEGGKNASKSKSAYEGLQSAAPPDGLPDSARNQPSLARELSDTEHRLPPETKGAPRVEPGSQRSGKTWQACVQASDKAVQWLASKVFDKDWVAKHGDVAHYFRAPLAFIEAGRESDADRALELASKWATLGSAGSACREYSSIYPQYPWLWIGWAAARLGRKELSQKCFLLICKYSDPITCSGVNSTTYSRGAANEFDFFATAVLAKAALLVSDLHLASLAGDSLLRAIEANKSNMSEGRFFLRWTWAAGLCEDRSNDPWHCVWQKGPGQLFFLLGFPAAVLAELELEGCKPELPGTAYRNGAADLLQYLQRCDSVLSSPSSHQVACAAARAKEEDFASKIGANLLKLQQASGAFCENPEAIDALDKTAEISICLRQMSKEYGRTQTGSAKMQM